MEDAATYPSGGLYQGFQEPASVPGGRRPWRSDSQDFYGQHGHQWLRKVGAGIRYELSFNSKLLHPVSSDNPDIRLNAKDLADLIRQLPIGYQTIFNLYAVEGFKHGEIGKTWASAKAKKNVEIAVCPGKSTAGSLRLTKNSLDNQTEPYARK